MAFSRWISLPTDILFTIAKILNTDVDILRLRSVCSSWRSSLPPRLRPSPFPLKLPLLFNCIPIAFSGIGDYYLDYTTIYRLSPPEYGPCAADSSDGWLFRVSEVNPNIFTLLSPLVFNEEYASGSVPEFLNLLNYRISEICKCYRLTFKDKAGFVTDLMQPEVQKISVISNDRDFSVFVLFIDGNASCWKYGQEDWSPMNRRGEVFLDMVVSNAQCYALSVEGELFKFDSNLKPTVIDVANLPLWSLEYKYYMLEYKSDLYVLLKTVEDMIEDEDEGEIRPCIPFSYEVFKKCGKNWENVTSLPDEVIISCEYVSLILPVEDFKSYKGNCVHMAMRSFDPCRGGRVAYYSAYDLSEGETAHTKQAEARKFMSWPPPSWLG